MLRNTIKRTANCFLLLIIMLVLLYPVVATKYVHLEFNFDQEILETIELIEDNYYYHGVVDEEEGIPDELPEIIFRYELYDAEGNIIYITDLYPASLEFADLEDQLPNLYMIRIFKKNQQIIESTLSFCNDNGVCEPCTSPNCMISENSLSCADCASGSADNYCDLVRDGICDPDCEGIDGDCTDCGDECAYNEKSGDEVECVKLGGTICDIDDECVGGEIESYKGIGCCFGGICSAAEEEEEIEIPEEEVDILAPYRYQRKKGLMDYLEDYLNYILLGVVVVIVALYFLYTRALPLQLLKEAEYYSKMNLNESQVKQYLLKRGWKQKQIKTALKKIRQQ